MNIDTPPYRVERDDASFRVVGPAELTVMVYGDSRSADHTAALLNKAWQSGYKTGYREGKSAARG